jgi:hypothetical protein
VSAAGIVDNGPLGANKDKGPLGANQGGYSSGSANFPNAAQNSFNSNFIKSNAGQGSKSGFENEPISASQGSPCARGQSALATDHGSHRAALSMERAGLVNPLFDSICTNGDISFGRVFQDGEKGSVTHWTSRQLRKRAPEQM